MFARVTIIDLAATIFLIGACTFLAMFFRHLIDPVNLVMIYLVAVVFIGANYGRTHSIIASVMSVSAFNFFFVEPYYSFGVYADKYYITLIFMLAASLIVSSVAAKLKLQSAITAAKNSELEALYSTASALTSCREHEPITQTAIQHVESALNVKTAIWLPDASQDLHSDAANWAYSHKEPCGKFTQTLPSSEFYCLPLIAQQKVVGVLGLALEYNNITNPVIAAYASLIASAIDRANATIAAEKHALETEREKLRATLLSAVGHDLRTPLASITGAASTLADQPQLSPTAAILAMSIYSEASRLNKLVSNLLDVTRMEAGALSLNREPYFIDELIGSALQRCKLANPITMSIAKDLPLLNIDGVLIEQVLINLLENAARYTPDNGKITISASQTPYALEVCISDSGIGIPKGSETTIFERYKQMDETRREGMGLGLAICKGIVEAHGGSIWVRNLPQGGAAFTFTLPLQFNKLSIESE